MYKFDIAPFEIFKGEHDDYYTGQRIIKLSDDEIEFNVFQYYNCYPENPKVEDLDLINEWKNKTTLKLSEDFIKTYQGSFLTSLKYALVQSSKRIYLLLIGDKETQPMIYISCIEEIWVIEELWNSPPR